MDKIIEEWYCRNFLTQAEAVDVYRALSIYINCRIMLPDYSDFDDCRDFWGTP
jgi:hypothetical protein